MAVLKCKMCGGELSYEPDATVCECEYCGSKQTLPKLNDDKKANLYDRANHFRRNNDFDKAMGIYEQILNEDNTDAEAYWSLVLCRYGIEYVEDPATHKRVPTVNRAQYTSIYADENYKAAIEHADAAQKVVYENEAKAIDEIQKGILEISNKEEPFDVFICYKETDAQGRRTQDSVLANDLYYQLTQEGFKVFFSRITLEDKLGTAYEPYIFAALNSSKVMVVLGTKPEFFNAVWVKNEWSRYLALISGGAKKMLIPAYRDMDPYDLPDEFSHLQAQDMSKLGFMQDLIRGIKKILDSEKEKMTQPNVVVQQTASGNNNDALLKRGNMALEDKEWQKADDFFEEVLNQDAECAEAYLGKWMAKYQCSNTDELVDYYVRKYNNPEAETLTATETASEHIDERAKKYYIEGYLSESQIRNIYVFELKYVSYVTSRMRLKEDAIGEIKSEKLYMRANQYADGATGELISDIVERIDTALSDRVKDAESEAEKSKLSVIDNYKNHIETSDKKAEEMFNSASDRREADYQEKIADYEKAAGEYDYKGVINQFRKMNGYKESEEYIKKCEQKIQEIKDARIQSEKKQAEKKKKIIMITTSIVAVAIIAMIIINTVIIPANKYSKAERYLNNKKYTEAIKAYKELGDYKDSKDKIKAAKYNQAKDYLTNKEYTKAYGSFLLIKGYKDVDEILKNDTNMIEEKKKKKIQVGNQVDFGNYKWTVLAQENGKALLITTDCVEEREYNEEYESITWENCTLRKYLNNEFYNQFNEEEKSQIVKTKVKNNDNSEYGTAGGNDTEDKIFLLSIDEANKYFKSDDERIANYDGEATWWWLRSPSYNDSYAAGVRSGGYASRDGIRVNYDDGAIRPALWINLES